LLHCELALGRRRRRAHCGSRPERALLQSGGRAYRANFEPPATTKAAGSDAAAKVNEQQQQLIQLH
jgi:hypothetical protein